MVFRRKYNTLTVTGTTAIRVPIIKRAAVDFALGADWTPAAGDVKILIDGTAAANVTNLPTAVAAGNGAMWEFILTAAELTCKQCQVIISDSATKVIEDQAFLVETFGNASAMYQIDYTASAIPATVAGSVASVTGNVGGNVVGSVASVTAGVTLAGSAVQAIWDALTSALTTVGSIGKLLATNVDAAISSRLSTAGYAAAPSAATVASAVWDEALAGHTTAGTAGKKLSDAAAAGTPPTAAAIASQVRTELTTELGRIDAATSTRATPAQVSTQVATELATTTYAEPGAVPAATSSLKDKIGWLFTLARNRQTRTATAAVVRNDAQSSNIATAVISDDGTTFVRDEWS